MAKLHKTKKKLKRMDVVLRKAYKSASWQRKTELSKGDGWGSDMVLAVKMGKEGG